MHHTTERSGRIREGSDRVMGGDIDRRGGGVEAGRLQGVAAATAVASLTSPSKIVLAMPIRRAIA
jgi:hypothetical protein